MIVNLHTKEAKLKSLRIARKWKEITTLLLERNKN